MSTRPGHGWRLLRCALTRPGRAALLLLGLLGLLGGCGEPGTQPRYYSKMGRITEIDKDTGEITLDVQPILGDPATVETVHWLVNKHSEIYEGGRLVSLDALKAGDPIELIGYPDPSSRPVRYVLTTGRLNRDVKDFKTPELPAKPGD